MATKKNQSKADQLIKLFDNELTYLAKKYEGSLSEIKSEFPKISYQQRYLISFYFDEEEMKPVYMISEQVKDLRMASIGQYKMLYRVTNLADFDQFFVALLSCLESEQSK